MSDQDEEEKKGDERIKVNKTDVQECVVCKGQHNVENCPKVKKLMEGNETEKKTEECVACKKKHDLDDFVTFKEMDARNKKDLLFSNKLCFACFLKTVFLYLILQS